MNKRTQRRFNIIDLLIVIVVIACIAGIIIRYNVVDRIVIDGERDSVQVSFMITDVSPDVVDAIKDGSVYYCEKTGNRIGKLLSHEVEDAVMVEINEAGEAYEVSDPDRKVIKGRFGAKGVMGENGFMLEGTQFITAGSVVTIQSLDVQVSVIITEIDHVKK